MALTQCFKKTKYLPKLFYNISNFSVHMDIE